MRELMRTIKRVSCLICLTITIGTLTAGTTGFRVVNSGTDFTEIEFILPDYEVFEEEYDGIKYQRFHHPEHGLIMEEGLPEVLSFSLLLSIPGTGTVELGEYEIHQSETQSGVNVFPSQGFNLEIDEKKGFLIDNDFYAKDINYPYDRFMVSTPAIMRHMRLVAININPFLFNPARQELTLIKRMTFRVNYDTGTTGENEITNPPRRLSRTFENLQRDIVINYDQFRNPATRNEYQQPSMIVVHHHTTNEQYVTALNQYLNWKRDKGFEITAINTANYSTTNAIKNFVLNAFNNWENPPEYLVLIGDKNSTVSVPMWTDPQQDSYTPGVANSDHAYSMLVGNDILSDIMVGRISVESGYQLASFWSKLRTYEREPYMENTNWYNNNLIVGQRESIGESAFFTGRYIHNVIMAYGDHFNNTQVYAAPYANQIQTVINQGAVFAAIRCWYSIGWTPQEAQFLNNFMPNIMIALTCYSLDFQTPQGLNLGSQFKMGTPITPKGAIGVLGMSLATDTAFNNYLTAAMYRGLFLKDMWTMGEAKVYSKYEHYRAFWNSHPWRARHYFHMLNLKGDPTMDVWKGVPKQMVATYPQQLPPGSNSILITVTDNQERPLKNAWVTIRKGTRIGEEDVFATGYTDDAGQIVHYFANDTSGDVKVTVTKHDYKPHLGTFEVTGAAGVTFNRLIANDDFDAGNQVNFVLAVRNHRAQAVNGVNGTISIVSDYINIGQNTSGFGNIAANAEGQSAANFVINIDPETPQGYRANFTLNITDNTQTGWISRFAVAVNNGKLDIAQMVIDDNDNGILDPLEEARVMLHLRNSGNVNLEEVYGALIGGGFGLVVVSDTAYFGNIDVNETLTSRDRHFAVSTTSYVMPGMIFNLQLHLFNDSGFSQTLPVNITIGTVTVDDPLGPDAYGYWIFDSGDETYMEAPVYEWIEIVPQLGGQGVNANLNADYNNIQQVRTMDLPFTFRFYGEEYDIISISVNGWITFVETQLSNQRNWRLPGPLGPDPIIAAFWDNLGLSQGGVYTYFDEEDRIFIIQWHNATNVQANAIETFQIILYDPEFYFTSTTDGPIKIQYKVFNNVNNRGGQPGGPQSQYGEWGNYCTIGISDHTGKIGLEYTFGNMYPAAARRLGNETALYITTGSLGFTPYVAIDEVSFVDDNDNMPMFGETGDFTMRLINLGGEPAFNVSAELATLDEYITIIEDIANFGDMESQQVTTVHNAYTIQIADDIPDKHRAFFTLVISAQNNIQWNFRFHVDIAAPHFRTLVPLVHDIAPGGNENGLVDPGEDIIVFLPIKNVGGAASPPVNVTITSQNPLVEIHDISETEFLHVLSGETMYPAISMSISDELTVGTGLVFNYTYETGEYEFSGNFLLGVGGVIPVHMGTGNAVTTNSSANPINIYFKSLHGQMVYTAAEMHNAGVTVGGAITEFGFWVAGAPVHPLRNFSIRMKHTEETNVINHIAGPYETVYANENYVPVADGWDMLTLNPPFIWNGVDNILVDTGFAPVHGWSSSGQVRYYEVENGYRFVRADNSDQTPVETTTTSPEKPQARFLVDTSAGDVTNTPKNLTAQIIGEAQLLINWDAPLNQEGLLGYNVYRNGTVLNEELIDDTEFIDTTFERTRVCYYYATAVYEETGETLPSNIVAVHFNFVDEPEIQPEEGIYYEPFEVTISTPTADAAIHYTLDGTEPTEESLLYQEPFEIVYHTTLKVKAFRVDLIPSGTISREYYILYPPRNLIADGNLESIELDWDAPWSPEDFSLLQEVPARANNIRSKTADDRGSQRVRERRNSIAVSPRNSNNQQVHRTLRGYNVYRSYEQEEFIRLNPRPITDTNYIDNDVVEANYRYYVVAVYEQGDSHPSQTINVNPSSIGEDELIPVLSMEAFPNPFNPETTILFNLPAEGQIDLSIYNIKGQLVKNLASDVFRAGRHRIVWNGSDQNGSSIASGLYFYRLTTEDKTLVGKLMLLK